jgi:hypothetical protein
MRGSSASARCFASTTIWASRRCRTCLRCASATPCSSPVAARTHRQHPDHDCRGARCGETRRLLRDHRRAARHGAEPCAATAVRHRHGAADQLPCRRHPRRKAQGAAFAQALDAGLAGQRRDPRPIWRRQHGGTPVLAYRSEAGVDPRSNTETFVALRTEISNWRWAGVPFYIRTGKRLASRDARIVVNFRPTPHAIFNSSIGDANRLVINLQPRDGLELHLLAQGQDNRRNRSAGTGAARPGFRQAFRLRACGRLRAAAARRDRRPAEPVRAQRRTGRSLALGGAMLDSWSNDAQGPRPYAPAPGARARPAP